jgi:hypothetical protein
LSKARHRQERKPLQIRRAIRYLRYRMYELTRKINAR